MRSLLGWIMADNAMDRRPRNHNFKRFTMSSNSTSTDTGAQSTSATSSSNQAASTPASSSVQSSSNANSSPSLTASSSDTPTSSSTQQSTSTPVSLTSSSTSESSTSNTPTTSSSNTPSTTSSTPSSTSATPTTSSSDVVTTPSSTSSPSVTTITTTSKNASGGTVTVIQTSTAPNSVASNTATGTSSSASSSSTADLQSSGKSSSNGLSSGGTIAVAVVVPIVAVALLVLAGLYFWRKRKARKDAEELRRKEVEEYGYNPNNDPTLPHLAGGAVGSSEGAYEMREDGSSGYRGWGTTAVASSGRKASTTVSGGQSPGAIGMAYSEGTSPTHGPVSDTRSDNPLMDANDRPISGEVESLGAMGPAASGNRGDINRGPSNASSSYSAANRSDGSGEVPGSYGAGQYYNGNNQYDAGNPYSPETQYGSPPGRAEMAGQPIIRDVQARRNTRIENPAHFPQQSAGISQNF